MMIVSMPGATPAPLPGYRGGTIGRGEDPEFSIRIDTHFSHQTDSRYIWQWTNQDTHDGGQFALQMPLGDAGQLPKQLFGQGSVKEHSVVSRSSENFNPPSLFATTNSFFFLCSLQPI